MLKNTQVHAWLRGTFRTTKAQEDEWGRSLVKTGSKMWTGMFGQLLIQELFPDGWRPKCINGHQPDWETPEFIIEVKTQSWFTPGTAGEKILGVPIKYRNVPTLYGKPLRIVLFGRAESIWFDIKKDSALENITEFWKSMGIEYVKGSELALPSFATLDSSSELPSAQKLDAPLETL
jgi:hypothetical protein